MSAISSRKSVPPRARSMCPSFDAVAPVNEFFSCPKSSLSRSCSGNALQWSVTNGPSRSALFAWITPRRERLARARGARDQHRRARGAGVGDFHEAALHARRRPHEQRRLVRRDGRRGHRRGGIDQLPHRPLHLREVEGFHQVGVRAERLCIDRILEVAVRGDDERRERQPFFAHMPQHAEAVHVRQADVEHQQRKCPLSIQLIQPEPSRVAGHRFASHPAAHRLERGGERVFILDDQDWIHMVEFSAGRWTRTRAPLPGMFVTSIEPPWAFTISEETLRPIPMPPSFSE